MKKTKRKNTPRKWRIAIRLRWLSRCAYCAELVGTDEHIDHIVPLAKGGGNEFFNLCFSCAQCNQSKGAKDEEPEPASIIGNVLAAAYWYLEPYASKYVRRL